MRMNATALAVGSDIDIRYPDTSLSMTEIAEVQRRLRTLVQSNVFVQEIIMMPGDLTYHYSSHRTYNLDDLYATYFDSPVERDRFRPFLLSLDAPYLFQTTTSVARGMPPFVYCVPLDPGTRRASLVLFVVPGPRFRRLMHESPGPELRQASLFDRDGRLVYRYSQGENTIDEGPVGARTQVSRRRSELTGYVMERRTSTDELGEHLRRDVSRIVLLVVAGFVLVVGVLAVMVRLNYQPLLGAAQTAEQVATGLNEDRPRASVRFDELDIITHALMSLARDRSEMLRAGGVTRRHAAEEVIFSSVVSGNLSSASVQQAAEELSLRDSDWFQVGIAQSDDGPLADPLPLETGRRCLYRRSLDGRRVYLVMQTSSESGDDAPELTPGTHDGFAIGLGRRRFGYRNLNRSYREAEYALQYRIVRPRPATVRYEHVSSLPTALPDDFNRLRSRLLGDLAADNGGAAARTLPLVLATLLDSPLDILIINSAVHDLLGHCLQFLSRRGTASTVDAADLLQKPNLEMLSRELSRVLATNPELDTMDIHHATEERIVMHITQNALSPHLSVANVAVEFGISQASVSTIFRRCTGETIRGFLTRVRIEKSKQLLETGEPVKNVVSAVGYTDTSCFIRTFRRYVGTTPGKYSRRPPHATDEPSIGSRSLSSVRDGETIELERRDHHVSSLTLPGDEDAVRMGRV